MATSDLPVDVVIPHSGLTEAVVLVEWLVDDGDQVDAGMPVVVIESEKTQIELDSPATGRIEIMVPATDDDISVGSTIGRIHR